MVDAAGSTYTTQGSKGDEEEGQSAGIFNGS